MELPFEKEFGVGVYGVCLEVRKWCVGVFLVDGCCCFVEDVVDGGGAVTAGNESGM